MEYTIEIEGASGDLPPIHPIMYAVGLVQSAMLRYPDSAEEAILYIAITVSDFHALTRRGVNEPIFRVMEAVGNSIILEHDDGFNITITLNDM